MNGASVAAFGAGRMGRGIAAAHALAGQDFALLDLRPRTAQAWRRLQDEARAELQDMFTRMLSLGCIDPATAQAAPGRVSLIGRDDAPAALAAASLLFEAVPETLDAKREALEFAGRHAAPDAIIASSSSTMLAGELAALVAHPERFLNTHWLNPAFIVPLIEVSPTPETDRTVLAEFNALLESIGKVPVVCAASPGYIVPRIQALAMNEAARLVEEGVATAEDVDKAVKYGFGFRFAILGLLEFIDWGGGDILYYASRYMADAMKDKRFEAPKIVHDNMAAGRNGLRDGKGFFDYTSMDMPAYRRERLAAFMRALKDAGLAKPPV